MRDLDIPLNLPVDTDGLPPARARLARLTTWRRVLDGQSLQLVENRERLVDELGEVAALEKRLAEELDTEAKGLLSAMRNGASWALSAITGSARSDLNAQLATARHRHQVGSAALVELDKELATLHATISNVEARISDALMDALLEHATATTGVEYASTLALLRSQLAQLEGLAHLTGTPHQGHRSRLSARLPGFATAGHTQPYTPVVVAAPDLEDSVATWWRLAAAWRDNPHADAAEHLAFSPPVDDPACGVPYDRLSEAERNFVDLQFAGL